MDIFELRWSCYLVRVHNFFLDTKKKKGENVVDVGKGTNIEDEQIKDEDEREMVLALEKSFYKVFFAFNISKFISRFYSKFIFGKCYRNSFSMVTRVNYSWGSLKCFTGIGNAL